MWVDLGLHKGSNSELSLIIYSVESLNTEESSPSFFLMSFSSSLISDLMPEKSLVRL